MKHISPNFTCHAHLINKKERKCLKSKYIICSNSLVNYIANFPKGPMKKFPSLLKQSEILLHIMIIVSYLFLLFKCLYSAIPMNIGNFSPKCALCTQGERQRELPMIDPYYYDPNLLGICDNVISEKAIYNGLMSILVQVENNLRTLKCSNILIHALPQPPVEFVCNSSNYFIDWAPLWQLRFHPFIGTFIDTMYFKARELLDSSLKCQLDMRLLMKLVRMSMKLLMNKVNCCKLQKNLQTNPATPIVPPISNPNYRFPEDGNATTNSNSIIPTQPLPDNRFPEDGNDPLNNNNTIPISSPPTSPDDYRFPENESITPTTFITLQSSIPTLSMPILPYRPCSCKRCYQRYFYPNYYHQWWPQYRFYNDNSISTVTISTTLISTTIPSDYRFPGEDSITPTTFDMETTSGIPDYRFPEEDAISSSTTMAMTDLPDDSRFPENENLPILTTSSTDEIESPVTMTSTNTTNLPDDYRFPGEGSISPSSTVPIPIPQSSSSLYPPFTPFRYPYFPPYYAPSPDLNINPSCQSPQRSDGSLWNVGMSSPCGDCDSNRNVII